MRNALSKLNYIILSIGSILIITGYVLMSGEGSTPAACRKEYIFERFYESLVQSYQSERSVKFYADQLCLTPKHLSGVVKEVSGKTVGEWIDELVILEAKALLNSSSMNIQEIADRLNFANQSFFGKYFKHYTGMSPKEYRKSR